MWVVSSGSVARWRNIEGQNHLMEIDDRGGTAGFYYIMNADTCYATAKCINPVVCYSISREDLLPLFEDPSFSKEVVTSLNLEIRRQIMTSCELGRTPLLEQKAKSTSYIATSIAASVESFYRSGMNAAIIAALSGSKSVERGALFPNMHLQIPTRVVYINGLKGLRQQIEHSDIMQNIESYSNPTAIRMAAAIAPGLLMTPMSSLLEAYNASHMNPEPLYRRWLRGIVPRSGREVIFGIGLNQLSDYCEERADFISNPYMRGTVASVMAGVLSGYLSHVPHNLSTLKLLNPHKSYKTLFAEYVGNAETRIPADIKSPTARKIFAHLISVFLPKGCLIRTTQIVGSFIILNGTINTVTRLFPALGPTPSPLGSQQSTPQQAKEYAEGEAFSRAHQQHMKILKARRTNAAEESDKGGSSEY